MLLQLARQLSFESIEIIDAFVDATGHYELKLNPDFPLLIKLFAYQPFGPVVRLNWHNRLEIFIPVAGRGSFRMGDGVLDFQSGDLIVVDNLKMHGLVHFAGAQCRAIVVTFKPELVCQLGSPLCDYSYLTPFYQLTEAAPPVLRAAEKAATVVHESLARLLSCYFQSPNGAYRQAGCKAYLLETLYLLAEHSGQSAFVGAEYQRHLHSAQQLGVLVEYLNDNYADKITIAQAAARIGMSESRFMKFFKQATGMTFVTYLNQLRLRHASRLLKDKRLSIAEVAQRVGFSDQSYFDRKFKQYFQRLPKEGRNGA